MKLKNSIKSIAIGSFDGIHKGHRALIDRVEAVVIIERNGGYLTPGYKRSFCFKQVCFFYHFDTIKSLRAKAFVEKLKEDFPLLETIVVGYDFEFGYKKEGDVNLLKELFDGVIIVIDEVKTSNISVHSRTIKSYIASGEVALVKELLGRAFIISGQVIAGQGLGKKELVPTLNLKVYDYELPKHGVYASHTKIGDRWLNSVTFLGHRISTDGSFSVESYVLDKDVGIVSGVLWIEFVSFIRMNKKFDGLKALKEQIVLDIEDSKRILKKEIK
jgi:riboflavin kinase/FMN adenylyltransferase